MIASFADKGRRIKKNLFNDLYLIQILE